MQPSLTRKLEMLMTFQSLKLLRFNSVCISQYDQQAAWQLTPPGKWAGLFGNNSTERGSRKNSEV